MQKIVLIMSFLLILYGLGDLNLGLTVFRIGCIVLGSIGILLYSKQIIQFFKELDEIDMNHH
jgi:hypothetical protein